MKQRSLRLVFASAGTLAALSLSAHADIVIMKDGKKFENATILSETTDAVTFKYMLTPRIPDTLTKQKADIAQLIKQRPEELEIVPLRKLLPSADLLTADKYEGIIQDQLRPFIAKYSGSAEAKEIETMIATLQSEKEKVVSGQLKVDGEWVTADVVKRDGHLIDAYRVRRAMNDLAAQNNFLEALRTWDKLSARDDGYTDTEHYVKAIPEVSKILDSYKKELEKKLREQPDFQMRRDNALKSQVEPELSRTKKAIDADVAKAKTDNEIEKKMKQRWLTVYKYDAKAIQAAQKVVVEEMSKIAVLDLNRLTNVIQSITAARRYFADANVEQAENSLTQASQNLGRDSSSLSSIISRLKSDINKLKMEQSKKRATQKVFGNPAALNSGSASTGTDDRVAKAMAEAEKAKAEKKEEKEAASGGLSSLNTSTSGKKSDDEKSSKKPVRKSTSTASAEPAEEGGIQKYALYGGIGLLVVLLSAMFLQKRPK